MTVNRLIPTLKQDNWQAKMSKQLILIFIFPELPIVKVHCSPEEMVVEMIKPFDTTHLYLEHLKNYPGEQNFCQMAVVYFLTPCRL